MTFSLPLQTTALTFARASIPLTQAVGLVSAGLRADASPSHRIDMGQRFSHLMAGQGWEALNDSLVQQGLPIRAAHLESDIYQTSDRNRSIVELISNGLDAGSKAIEVRLEDGFYEVRDTGSGMSAEVLGRRLLLPKLTGNEDPTQQIGLFGIGFYTTLRHLQQEGDQVLVETQTQDGTAHRLIFQYMEGEICFASEEMDETETQRFCKLLGHETGTRVLVHAQDIQESSMRQEMWRYLRYVDPSRPIKVNGEVINRVALKPLKRFAFGDKGQAEWSWNPKGMSGAAIKVGDVIMDQNAASGRVAKGEWVLTLPYGIEHAITRDQVAVDETLVNCLEQVLGEVTEIEQCNALVPMFEALEKRNPPRSVMDLLRKRTEALVEAGLTEGVEVYPDRPEFEKETALFVHPELYAPRWWDRFEVPDEFQSGEVVNGQGPGRAVRLVLSDAIQKGIVFDRDLGVIYLNRGIYRARPDFILSALFLIENLEFRVEWGRKLLESGLETQGEETRIDEIERPMVPSSVDEIDAWLETQGLEKENFARTWPLRVVQFCEGWTLLKDKNGYRAIDSQGRSVLFLPYEGVQMESHGGELFFKVRRGSKTGVLNRNGDWELEFGKYSLVEMESHGGEIFFNVLKDENGDQFGVLNRNGDWEIELGKYDNILIQSHGDELFFSVKQGDTWGVLNRHGDWEIELWEYTEVWIKSHGDEIFFKVEKADTWGVLNRNGEWEIELGQYNNIVTESHGGELFFSVKQGDTWGVLNRHGDWEIELWEYTEVWIKSHGDEIFFEVEKDDTWGVLNRNGDWELELGEYDLVEMESHGGELFFKVSKDGKEGVLNRIGDWELELGKYDFVQIESHGGEIFFKVRKDGKSGVLNRQGRQLWPEQDIINIKSLGSEIFLIAESVNNTQILSYSKLHRLTQEPHLQERLQELRKHRLNIATHLDALTALGDETWQRFMEDPELRLMLATLGDPVCAAYAENDAEAGPRELNKAFALITQLGVFGKQTPEVLARKIHEILNSRLDTDKLLESLRTGVKTHDTKAVQLYLKQEQAALLPAGEAKIPALREPKQRLADVITHLRLQKKPQVSGLGDIPAYNNEQEARDLNHALHHLSGTNPYAYVRELLQNGLDVLKAGEASPIAIETYESNGQLVLGFKDPGGMDEEDLVALLNPGDSQKRGKASLRGQFGTGFYAALAEANWVRIKTAKPGAEELWTLAFEVERNARGEIVDITLQIEREANTQDFKGTLVETERYGDLPALEAARLETTTQDMGRYISQGLAELEYNGQVINQGSQEPLVTAENKELGRVELYDGLDRRILLGQLPLSELPEELWSEVPKGVKKYYQREGFYLNLDHKRVETTPTRDRFRHPDLVLGELKKLLPGLLIQGFLQRVADPKREEGLYHLPEVYFIQAYELASSESLGKEIEDDASALNAGRYGEVDYAKYTDPETGERELLKLLTLVKFIRMRVGGELCSLSLQELHTLYQQACASDPNAIEKLKEIRASGKLPPSIDSRLEIAEGDRSYTQVMARQIEKQEDSSVRLVPQKELEPDRHYYQEDFQDPGVLQYLRLAEQITKCLYRHFRSQGKVQVGISTMRPHVGKTAYTYRGSHNFHLYYPVNNGLKHNISRLTAIAQNPNREEARSQFEKYLNELVEVISHELTHNLTERPDRPDFPHDPKFYADQMEILLTPPVIEEQADRWFEAVRA